MENPTWSETLVRLLALASRLEGEGQYNLAKVARASADALSRNLAWKYLQEGAQESLENEFENVVAGLASLKMSEPLLTAFRQGQAALQQNRLPLIHEIPHPYVCRTCGHPVIGEPPEKCPHCGAWGGTFQWFPAVYWLEALDPTQALERLRQTPLEVTALLAGLTEAEMTRPPENGGWAMRNAISHLRDAQEVIAYRVDLFLKEENPVLEVKAVWTWAKDENTRSPSTHEIFAAYQSSRQAMIAKLESIPFADWWRTGRHEEFGIVSLKQQVSYFASHELTHLSQIAKLT